LHDPPESFIFIKLFHAALKEQVGQVKAWM
jgi:hypothetical protein